MSQITVDFSPVVQMTDEQFWQLCQRNRDLKFERNANGELIIVTPTGSDSGSINLEIEGQLWSWSRQHRDQGRAFNSSTGFKLPNGSDRSPGASWVQREKLIVLTAQQKRGFAPVCPDFVVELKSSTDDLSVLRAKSDSQISRIS